MIKKSLCAFAPLREIFICFNNRRNTFIIIMALIISSCEKRINWDITDREFNTIVVEATLTNEYKFHKVKLSLPRTDANQSSLAVTGAIVTVSNGDTTLNFIENADMPGIYTADLKFAATLNTTYYLSVYNDSELYEANTYMIPVNISGRLQYAPVEDSAGYYQIYWIGPEYSQEEQAMYEIEIDWTHLVNGNFEDTITKAKLFHYTFNTIDVSYTIFPQDKEKIYFPKYSIIIEKKYSVTDEYAAYLRALLAETEWQGSLFENARANLPTNITNGGLGYFSVCSVISDTLIVH